MEPIEVPTTHGPARLHLHPADSPVAAMLLGHGAGGGVTAPDLVLATAVARSLGVTVALSEQPYRVAGRRAPAPAPQLDTAFTQVAAYLRDNNSGDLPLITGGRSSGARVACRTAQALNPIGVLCLAFPLHPPGKPDKSRLPELDGAGVPTLVVQGSSDPFGMPPEAPGRTMAVVAGDHSLKKEAPAQRAAIEAWLTTLLKVQRQVG